ncbi:MAG: protoheme IX farnesyltransferase [Flavobacteriales bacterium]
MNQTIVGTYNYFNDYFELTKPTIGLLVLFTAFASMYLAAKGSPKLDTVLFGLLGIGLASAASGVLNNYIDRDIDPLMQRTKRRALAAGRVSSASVLVLGFSLALMSFIILTTFVNLKSALLAIFVIFFYVAIYSKWLKRTTYWCTEIGGVAGALPPLIGWLAITNSISWDVIPLFLLLFLWQPPHFWALALLKTDEYKNAGIPMLPVVKGELATKRRMLIYTIALLPVSLLLCVMYEVSLFFYIYSLLVNAIYLFKTLTFYRSEISRKASMSLFSYSILYIFLMFGMLFFIV